MSKINDNVYRCFRVVNPATGLGVTGLLLADFTIVGYKRAYGASPWAVYALGAAIAEIADGWYGLDFTNPAAAGYRLATIKPVLATYQLTHAGWDGEVMSQDLASIYAAVAKPVVTVSSSGSVGQIVPLTLIAYRYRQLVMVFRDQNGVAIDFPATYNNLQLGIRDKTQSDATAKWDLTTAVPTVGTISGDASGNLTVTFPEDATFFAKIANPATTLDPYSLQYEITGDLLAVSKTVSLVPSSPLTLLRREYGT